MTTLILKDLSRFDKLDSAASRSVRGGIASLTREMPGPYHGAMMPPVFVPRGWGEYAPVHPGCGPVTMPWFGSPSQPERKVTPL
jgi:hypothetical protein